MRQPFSHNYHRELETMTKQSLSTAEGIENNETTYEVLLKRFGNSAFDCDTIRKHINECLAFLTICRATVDMPEAYKYNLVLLALKLAMHRFDHSVANNLDAADTYLNNLRRGADILMYKELEALVAVRKLPFIFRVLGDFPEDINKKIDKMADDTNRQLTTANKLQQEIIICQSICSFVEIAEQGVPNSLKELAYRHAAIYNEIGVDKQRLKVQQVEPTNPLEATLADLLQWDVDIYEALGVAKKQEKERQAGLTRKINDLQAKGLH